MVRCLRFNYITDYVHALVNRLEWPLIALKKLRHRVEKNGLVRGELWRILLRYAECRLVEVLAGQNDFEKRALAEHGIG